MYRDYENPYELEKELEELKKTFKNAKSEEEQVEIHEDIADLKERINLAWQDWNEEER